MKKLPSVDAMLKSLNVEVVDFNNKNEIVTLTTKGYEIKLSGDGVAYITFADDLRCPQIISYEDASVRLWWDSTKLYTPDQIWAWLVFNGI